MGNKILAGKGVRTGSDYTLYAVNSGKVKFQTIRKKNFDGSRRLAKVVNVI